MAPELTASTIPQSGILGFVPVIIIFFIFYFLLIRPQASRIREMEKKREGLQKGDKVITGGGLFATVEKVEDQVIHIMLNSQVRVEALRSTIMDVIKK